VLINSILRFAPIRTGLLVILALLTAASASAAPNDSQLTPRELVSQIRRAYAWHENVRLTAETTLTDNVDGGHVYTSNAQYAQSPGGIQWIGARSLSRPDGAIIADYQNVYELRTAGLLAYAEREEDDHYALGHVLQKSEPAAVPAELPECGSAAWGYPQGLENKNLCDLLEQAPDLACNPNPQNINGQACIVLTATTPHGAMTVALAPEKAYVPVELRITTTGQQTMGGRTAESAGVRQWDTKISFAQFTALDGTWIPASVTEETRSTMLNGNATHQFVRTVTLRDIELNPVFDDKDFSLAIMPDGTFLRDAKVSEVIFRLKEGNLSPYFNDAEVAAMDKTIDDLLPPSEAPAAVARVEPVYLPPRDDDPRTEDNWNLRLYIGASSLRLTVLMAGIAAFAVLALLLLVLYTRKTAKDAMTK